MISALVSSISGAWMLQPLRALDAGLGGEVRHPLEGVDVLGAAVGIAAVVERVDADEDVARAEHLGPREREREEDRVARRHVGDRDPRAHLAHPCDPWGRRCRRSAPSRRRRAGRCRPPHAHRHPQPPRCAARRPAPSRAAGRTGSSARTPSSPRPARSRAPSSNPGPRSGAPLRSCRSSPFRVRRSRIPSGRGGEWQTADMAGGGDVLRAARAGAHVRDQRCAAGRRVAEGRARRGRARRGEAERDRRAGEGRQVELPGRRPRRQARGGVVLPRHRAEHGAGRLLGDEIGRRARWSASLRTTATCASASAPRSGSRSGGARSPRRSRCATC